MKAEKKFFIFVGILGSILILAFFIWLLPKTGDQQAGINEPQKTVIDSPVILGPADYQKTVEPLLSACAAATDVKTALSTLVDKLQGLTVSTEISRDHLTLFQAFDTWQRYPTNVEMQVKVRDLLNNFSVNQTWSQAVVASIIAKHLPVAM